MTREEAEEILEGKNIVDYETYLEAVKVAVKALIASPNLPLTLEELREMDGEPVWAVVVQQGTPEAIGWMLVDLEFESAAGTHDELGFDSYGPGGWLAYRRSPEEGIQ